MQEINGWNGGRIKAWVDGVEFEYAAQQQVHNMAGLPFIHEHIAIMPDVHHGRGATVGSVIPTKGAIIPAAVGVDIGCGMMAIRLSLTANDLPDSLAELRTAVEARVPHGGVGPGAGWAGKKGGVPAIVDTHWKKLDTRFKTLTDKTPHLEDENHRIHLGSLGGGNHFIELCLDEDNRVWVMLHSGSRGIGNAIGRYYIDKAREVLETSGYGVPDKDLAWFDEGTPLFRDYIEAMLWAQDYAVENRKVMMQRVLMTLREYLPPFTMEKEAINCHHNFAAREHHFGEDVWITRKGATSAKLDELGIIPGSMGAKSFIVRGKGNPQSFCSCSHGAGRRLSRGKAKATFTVEDHARMTEGVECRKDSGVIDETPGAYKDIDAVIAAEADLIEVVHTLKQVMCIKG